MATEFDHQTGSRRPRMEYRTAEQPAPVVLERVTVTASPATGADDALATAGTPGEGDRAQLVSALAREVLSQLKRRLSVEAERRGRW